MSRETRADCGRELLLDLVHRAEDETWNGHKEDHDSKALMIAKISVRKTRLELGERSFTHNKSRPAEDRVQEKETDRKPAQCQGLARFNEITTRKADADWTGVESSCRKVLPFATADTLAKIRDG